MGFVLTLADAPQALLVTAAVLSQPHACNRSFEKLMFLVEQAHWFYEVRTYRLCVL